MPLPYYQTAEKDLQALHRERDTIQNERVALDKQLYNAGFLPPAEDRR